MKKNIKFLLALITVMVIIVIYVWFGFYKIEHVYLSRGATLITKQSEMYSNLNNYAISFDNVVHYISEDVDHDYFLCDMTQNDDIITLSTKCNVEWIRVNSKRDCITFYQTAKSRKSDEIILSYCCKLNSSGEFDWVVTDKYPDNNTKETLSVKLYNLLFNYKVV